MMAHLDFEVADFDGETERAVALGAELPRHRLQAGVRVLLDPAGHPFCPYTDESEPDQVMPSEPPETGSTG